MAAEHTQALEIERLHLRRPGSAWSLQVPHLRLARGEAVALLGSSGVGKTSLLLGALGIDPGLRAEPGGRVDVLGRPLPPPGTAPWRELLRRDVGLVLQDARAALDPLRRLGVQVAEAAGEAVAACTEILRRLGEPDPARVLASYPHQVSGGEAQRCLWVAVLLRRPSLFVLDEPTASLDGERRVRALAQVRAAMRDGAAVLLATHEAATVAGALDARPLHVADGCVRPGAPPPAPWPRPAAVAADDVVVQVHGLTVRYGRREVLRGVSLALHRGEIVAVLGPSGCGKTTLARALVGHLRPAAGRIDPPPPGPAWQYLWQDAHASLTPGVAIARLLRETLPRGGDPTALAAAVGLTPATLARSSRGLSGGERRRAALLRALTVRPRLLILDEPTASLDPVTAAAVMQVVVDRARGEGLACLLITHDEELAAAVAHRVLHLREGALSA